MSHLTALVSLGGHCYCPAFQKLEHLLKVPIWSPFGETMCEFPATIPSQLWKASEPFSSLFQSMRTLWLFMLAAASGNPIQICLTLWSSSAFAVECSVWINLLDPLKGAASSIILMVCFQLQGQRTLPVYKHEIDSHCLGCLGAGKNRLRSDEKVKLREVKGLAPNHTAINEGSNDQNTSVLTIGPVSFHYFLNCFVLYPSSKIFKCISCFN